MTTRPTPHRIITRAVALLGGSLLPSNLPARLMREFDLSRDRAGKLAKAAVRRYRQEQDR